MWRSSAIVVIFAIAGCTGDGFVGGANVSGNTRNSSTAAVPLTLENARHVLETQSELAVGPVALNGYSFHREVEVGRGERVIVISRNLGRGLLAFNANGANFAAEETNEITWIQLFDLDEDGLSEVVTEEIEGRGTGVLDKRFHIYRIAGEHIQTLWTGESYLRRAPTSDSVEERVAFIRFDMSGAGRKARLTHWTIDAVGRQQQSTLEWRLGELRVVE